MTRVPTWLPWLTVAVLAALGLWLLQPPTGPENATQAPTSAPTTAPAAPTPPPAAPTEPTPTITPATEAAATTEAPAPTEPAGGPGELPDGAGEPVDPTTPLTPTSEEQATLHAQARDTATQAATAFARPTTPDADPDTWWATLSGYLAERAATDYQGIDPAAVPYTQLTGPAQVLPSGAPADLLTIVGIPTDAGLLRVELERGPAGWQVTYFDLPDEVSS